MKLESISDTFSPAIRRFAKVMARNIGETVKEESRFLAERLRRLTPPSNAKQGKDAVERDVKRVYQRSEWFEQTFQFRNQRLNARVRALIQGQDEENLGQIFQRSPRLARLRAEAFNAERHSGNRDARGRVRFKSPVSFPVKEQAAIAAYIKARQKSVGSVKGGWGRIVALLGGKSPAWLNRSSGRVADHSSDPNNPSVEMTNSAPTAYSLTQRLNILPRAVQGRARDLSKKIGLALANAKQGTRL